MATVEELRYTPGSLDLRDKIRERLAANLGALASKRARDQGRSVVTVEDVEASIQEAVEQTLREVRTKIPPIGERR